MVPGREGRCQGEKEREGRGERKGPGREERGQEGKVMEIRGQGEKNGARE